MRQSLRQHRELDPLLPDRDQSNGVYDDEGEGEPGSVASGHVDLNPTAVTSNVQLLTTQLLTTTSSSALGHWFDPALADEVVHAIVGLDGVARMEALTHQG